VNEKYTIKALLLTLILTLVSMNATAEWTLVLMSKEANQYVDLATIRVSDNIAKM